MPRSRPGNPKMGMRSYSDTVSGRTLRTMVPGLIKLNRSPKTIRVHRNAIPIRTIRQPKTIGTKRLNHLIDERYKFLPFRFQSGESFPHHSVGLRDEVVYSWISGPSGFIKKWAWRSHTDAPTKPTAPAPFSARKTINVSWNLRLDKSRRNLDSSRCRCGHSPWPNHSTAR